MPIRGVIFDLGGTLLHYNAPNTTWEDTEKTGAGGIYRHLAQKGYALPPEPDALETAWTYLFGMWNSLDQHDATELKLDRQIKQVAGLWGANHISDELAHTLGIAYMEAIQMHVRPLEGAADTLRALRERGLRLGLVSNTIWPGDYHLRDLDHFALTPYLEHLIFSADADAWKPHAPVFHLVLDALDLAPGEAVFVGDSLYFDVWGAQQTGLRGVWIEQPRWYLPNGIKVTPDATIQTLPDLLDLLDVWGQTDKSRANEGS